MRASRSRSVIGADRLALYSLRFKTSQLGWRHRMSLTHDKHRKELRAAGWHTRGYLPHFDGRALPQFITLHLADAIPKEVFERWKLDLRNVQENSRSLALRRRVERFVDQGHGNCFLLDHGIATIVQDALLHWHQVRYKLFAWVIMPNHSHFLLKRFECCDLRQKCRRTSHLRPTRQMLCLAVQDRSGWKTTSIDTYVTRGIFKPWSST